MKWMHLLLPVVVAVSTAYPAQAQLFSRKIRLNNMQVPELIVTARSDPDERKRVAALEQLREFDVKTYPEMIPSLIEVMLKDARPGVRMEAMHSLARIRPVTPAVGQALQQTAQNDDNWRVRMQTRTQLWMTGYHGGNGNAVNNQQTNPNAPTTAEPPLANTTAINKPAPPVNTPPANITAITKPAPQPINVPTPAQAQPPTADPAFFRPLPSRPLGPTSYSTAVPQRPTEGLPQIPPAPPPAVPMDPVDVPIVPPR